MQHGLHAFLACLPPHHLSLGQSIEGQQVQGKGASHTQITFGGTVVMALPMIGGVGIPKCCGWRQAAVVQLAGSLCLRGPKGTEGPAGS